MVKFITTVTEAVKEMGKPQLSACGDTAQLTERRVSSGALDCVYSLWYNAPTILPAGSIVGALYHKL